MDKLHYSLDTFTLCGVWRPLSWSSGWKKNLYDFYTIFVLSWLYSYAIMKFIDAMQVITKINEFVDSSFMLASVCNSSIKVANLLYNRENIIELLTTMNKSLYLSKNKEEDLIHAEADQRVKINFTFLFCIIGSAVVTNTITTITKDIPARSLPFNVWVPFYNNSERVYWTLLFQQVIVGHVIQSAMCVANDTFITGIMLLTCEQLRILKNRQENMLKEISSAAEKHKNTKGVERNLLNDLIQQHKTIIKFAERSNNLFAIIIFIQYTISCIFLCMSEYRCTQMDTKDPNFPFAIIFAMCMVSQIFYFCWYGNEVILESSAIHESLYKMDWILLDTAAQKDLLIIMYRTTRPIFYTSGKIMVLSIESFKQIVKLSYSAFNVLQQT